MAIGNSGYYNSGDYNSGNCNSGNYNSGNYNSGNYNSGNYNSGNYNSGYCNSGNYNSGYCNSGYYNSGNCNSGYYNSGYCNSGAFNRDCPKMRLFEKELHMTVKEFYDEYDIHMDLPLNVWINKSDMTDKEKSEVSGWKEMGGYLKTLEYKEACQKWWTDNPNDHDRFLGLPGFDAEIFEDITGINVNTKVKEMTVAEISKELGYEVKVVKE